MKCSYVKNSLPGMCVCVVCVLALKRRKVSTGFLVWAASLTAADFG